MYKQDIKKSGIVIPKDSPPIRPMIGIIKIKVEASSFIKLICSALLEYNLQELLRRLGALRWIMMD